MESDAVMSAELRHYLGITDQELLGRYACQTTKKDERYGQQPKRDRASQGTMYATFCFGARWPRSLR
jgi:hypothetical protein